MIYEYEGELLKFINKVFPSIKEITYAKEESLLMSFSQVLKYPAVYYTRSVKEWNFPPTWSFLSDEGTVAKFVPVEQNYVARMYLANELDVLNAIAKLRIFWSTNSYLNVPWNGDKIRVGLRLLYIKADEDRSPSDKKGVKRYLEFSWMSRLFIDEVEDKSAGLVKEVRIFLSDDGKTVNVKSNDNLIKVIQ